MLLTQSPLSRRPTPARSSGARACALVLLLPCVLACEQERWQQRTLSDLGLTAELPCALHPGEMDVIKGGPTTRAFYARCVHLDVVVFEVRLPSEAAAAEDEMLGSLMDIFARRAKLAACERAAIRVSGHLGAELSCEVSEKMAREGLGLRRGGPLLVRLAVLAPEHRALIWYASGTDLIARRFVSSVGLEER